jgi:hypothetical protein
MQPLCLLQLFPLTFSMDVSSYLLEDAMISEEFSGREISVSDLLVPHHPAVLTSNPFRSMAGGGVLIGHWLPSGLGLAARKRRDMLISEQLPTTAWLCNPFPPTHGHAQNSASSSLRILRTRRNDCPWSARRCGAVSTCWAVIVPRRAGRKEEYLYSRTAEFSPFGYGN